MSDAIAQARAEADRMKAEIEALRAVANAVQAERERASGVLRRRIAHSGILPSQLTAGAIDALAVPPALFAN